MKLNISCSACGTELLAEPDGRQFVWRHALGDLGHEPTHELIIHMQSLANRMKTAEMGLNLGGPTSFVAELLRPVMTEFGIVMVLLDKIPTTVPGIHGQVNPLAVDAFARTVDIPDDLSGLD